MHYDSFECHELLAKVIHDLFLLFSVADPQIFTGHNDSTSELQGI